MFEKTQILKEKTNLKNLKKWRIYKNQKKLKMLNCRIIFKENDIVGKYFKIKKVENLQEEKKIENLKIQKILKKMKLIHFCEKGNLIKKRQNMTNFDSF